MEGFKKLVDELTIEYEDYYTKNLSGLTCEFSTSSENFEEKVDYIMTKNVKFGQWKIFKCATCKEQNEKTPWHVYIDNCLSWEEQNALSQKLKVDYFQMKQSTNAILDEIKGKEYYPKGTLKSFVDWVECLIDNPQQYDEYVRTSFVADNVEAMTNLVKGCNKYNEHAKILEELIKPDEPQVLYSQSNDVFIEKDGSSRWNMFSEVNGGRCAFVDLRDFTEHAGKRMRVSVGVL